MSIFKDKTIVLIPAYKPENELLSLLDELLSYDSIRVLVVNDGSGAEFDKLFDTVRKKTLLLEHAVNQGKGCALKTGFKYIKENFPDCKGIITADADGQHRYKDIINVAAEISDTKCLVVGCRRFTGYVPFRSKFGNKLTKMVFAAATNKKISDVQTGLRGFSPDILEELIQTPGKRYEYEINMLLEATQNGYDIREVEIATVYQPGNTSSHFSPIRDSIKIYICIFKFILSSMLAFSIDYVAVLLFNAFFASINFGDAAAVTLAAVGARIISSFINFIINRNIVFKSHESPAKSAVKYYALVTVILGLNILLLNLTNVMLGIPLWIAKILVEVSLFFVNYILQRKIVFKH